MPQKHWAFKIREADGGDLASILHLINSRASAGSILKRTRKDVRKALRNFLVAEKDGQVIGCGALEIYNKKLAEIRSLVVDAHHQKKGVASALIERCVTLAAKKEIYEVLVITDRDNLFTRHGFSQQLHGQKALFLRP